jgi:hypothetical protein
LYSGLGKFISFSLWEKARMRVGARDGPLTPALDRLFPTRSTGYIRVAVSQREREYCGYGIFSFNKVLKIMVSDRNPGD